MVLIDTSVLYLLSGCDNNEKIDLKKLNIILSYNKVAITLYSLFEIINNPNYSEKYNEILTKITNKYHLYLIFDNCSEIYYKAPKIFKFPSIDIEEQDKIHKCIGRYLCNFIATIFAYEIAVIIHLYLLEYCCNLNIVFNKVLFNDFTKKENAVLTKLYYKLIQVFDSYFNNLLTLKRFNEKERNKAFDFLYLSIIAQLFDLVYYYSGPKANEDDSVDQIINRINKTFESLDLDIDFSVDLKPYHENMSLYENLRRQTNLSSEIVKKNIMDRIETAISLEVPTNNIFIKNLIQYDIFNKIVSCNSSKSNTLIDFILANVALSSDKFDSILTLDKKFLNKLQKVYKENEKVILSIKNYNAIKKD